MFLCFLSPKLNREILQYTKEVTPWIYIEDKQKKNPLSYSLLINLVIQKIHIWSLSIGFNLVPLDTYPCNALLLVFNGKKNKRLFR